MPIGLSVQDLMEYTEWERAKWLDRLNRHGQPVLEISAGPHGDGRFQTIGDLVKHIFAAEKRYVERLLEKPLTEASTIPNDVAGLFEFGRQSRNDLKALIASLPAEKWDAQREFKILSFVARVSPKKIVLHVLMHEIRHWAQIATMLRLQGMVDEFHDFLVSPVLGGEFMREEKA
jgi:uncharacterized damage-inducible protein DinB